MKDKLKSRFSKERLAKFFDKEGFYIVLFLCVCIVAITAVWVSRTGLSGQDKNLGNADKNKAGVTNPATETSTKTGDKTNLPGSNDGKASQPQNSENVGKSGNTSSGTQSSTAAANFKADSPIKGWLPVNGIMREYSPTDLVEYKYPGQWRVHMGFDMRAVEGTEVLAVSGGRVVEIRDDNEDEGGLGWTVVIDHGNGYRTVYANLDKTLAIKMEEGKTLTVKKGQKIGTVGNTSIFEKDVALDGTAETPADSHLHFEVLKKNAKTYENVDPEKYLTMQN